MRLVSIINAWIDTIELLPKCIKNHLAFCDGVIVVVTSESNYGNPDNGVMGNFITDNDFGSNVHFVTADIDTRLTAQVNESRKRNKGLDVARSHGFTHFFLADADEFYLAHEVRDAKERFSDPTLNGLVCRTRVYIAKPTLWVADHTLISFIHKLKPQTMSGAYPSYPNTYDDHGNAHIDPTRRINEVNRVEMCDVTMHHMSYVRDNIDLKIQNSSANLKRSEAAIKRDIANARYGYKVTFNYHQELQECYNLFAI